MKFSSLLSFVFAALLPAFALQADDAKGPQLFQVCAACHGDQGQGNQALKAPTIAHNNVEYLIKQITKFKTGIRGAHPQDVEGLMMKPMMLTLRDDADITAVATYISQLPEVKPESTIKDGDKTKGQMLYATCLTCHGDKAQGYANPQIKAPSLQYLPDWYMLTQLRKFKEGIRGSNPKDTDGALMSPMAKMLADEQAQKDVIAYILSLTPSK